MASPTARRLPAPPLSEPVDVLLADVAIRIQLSRTDYRKAEERYATLGEWIDRKGSPLAGRVQLVYPQGSMATGTTIASRLTTDEHDVDFIAQLGLPHGTAPGTVLDLLMEHPRRARLSLLRHGRAPEPVRHGALRGQDARRHHADDPATWPARA